MLTPTQTAPLTPNIVPASGTLRRCMHGVYIGVHDCQAFYCIRCTPDGLLSALRAAVLFTRLMTIPVYTRWLGVSCSSVGFRNGTWQTLKVRSGLCSGLHRSRSVPKNRLNLTLRKK